MTKSRILSNSSVQRVLEVEANAILTFSKNCEACVDAANLIYAAKGPLIVSGIGKSGYIANKIASTFRSLGKPAIFLHPAEASHGDLGLIQPESVMLVLSYSGETTELSDMLHYCKAHDIKIIGMTGEADSTLARASDLTIIYGKLQEACLNGLAPTTSTTLSLAIGDALAVTVSELLGTEPEDFRRFHPGGRLGARLTLVSQIMKTGDQLPLIDPDENMAELLVTISEKALGLGILYKDGIIEGIITDGDLRRHIKGLLSRSPREIATTDPFAIQKDWLVSDAIEFMSLHKISVCLVIEDNGDLIGVVHILDCMRLGTAS